GQEPARRKRRPEMPTRGFSNVFVRDFANPPSLRIGGQEPAAQILCRNGRRYAYLYRTALAKPVRPMTLAKEAALDRAMAARQTCPACGIRYEFCLPLTTLGSCFGCSPEAAPAPAAA
ncbi:RRQRL motif-containing zinc-binding protein, partial [Streptomyces sp. NPDC093109]|uniref:RRQRL motif-containing zinc-binding protein n=1 Tax=Streptomyces sp. NPDC093109 TaxID=3154977 RepID=UPI00344B802F